MSELCRRQIIRQQQIMKKGALTVLIALLPLAAIAQTPSINEDGKKIEKEKTFNGVNYTFSDAMNSQVQLYIGVSF